MEGGWFSSHQRAPLRCKVLFLVSAVLHVVLQFMCYFVVSESSSSALPEGGEDHVKSHFCCRWCCKKTRCVTILAGFTLLCNVKSIRNINAVCVFLDSGSAGEDVGFMGFTEKTQY